MAFAWWRHRKSNLQAKEDPEFDLGQLKRFSLHELQVATDNFSNRNILGRGGFGKVYKGRLADGTLVAVKRSKEKITQGGELQFQTEVEMISMAVHRNLLRLIGFCVTTTERLLVYPYMANGSVASCLRERPDSQEPLDWSTRKRIALGSARGLAYLHDHCDPKIIHRDVKAANILLDEEFEAVVGDFGLAKLMDYKDTDVTTAVRGTIGHIAPEYLYTGRCSEKTDVFAYGVMLLELITGKRAFDLERLANDEDVMLLDWVKGLLREDRLETLVDVELRGNYIDAEVEQLIQVVLLCTQGTPSQRPKMSDVVEMFEGDGLAKRWVALLSTQGMPLEPPKMSEVVKMFEDDGLAERWEEWKKEGMLRQGLSTARNPNTDWIIADSTYNLRPDELSGPTATEEEVDQEFDLGQLKRFSFLELQVATDNFSNRHILGRGGFGKVYKGRLTDGTLVAVKRLKEKKTQAGELQFQIEVEILSRAGHRNVLRLKGFCVTPIERLLVYPFMANGSVASCLREKTKDKEPLDWSTRKRIALGSARGLAYLHDHCDPKIIHRDVKAANILLDEEFEAVIGDFGLAKLLDSKDTDVTTAVRGTIGHIAPEYLSTGKCSVKTDVFGYGIMLLELITGQRAFDLARLANDEDVMLLDWVKGLLREKKLERLVDADLKGGYIDIELEHLIQVALLCTQGYPLERPKILEVVRMLEGVGLELFTQEFNMLEGVWLELFTKEFNTTRNPNTDWIIADSTYNLRSDELSGPR